MRIRDARPGEAAAISALCVRSKAHWGYDEAFMARAARGLTLDEAELARIDAIVAEDGDGRLLGVAALDRATDPVTLDLLFVDPPAIGTGVGAALHDAIVARARGGPLQLASDPNAEPFYLARGWVRDGVRRAPATGRDLARLRRQVRPG